ncbi:hypothetical protein OIU77_003488 [Salix suchowensis]|uniref:Pentatricopeptide repeat-containing protein n=1 Tax=Salix suchowensis TaxID=1278906 RepID=A0ABQ9B2W1_9ROSI|nr:hypothetical protein OIU77_003488 [Salix suchowensis]
MFIHGNLFDELPHRDLYSLNSQLASYSRDGNFLATWDLFSRIHSAFFELDAYTFSPVLRACSALPDTKCGRQVHALMIKTGTDLGTITKTALMDMYSKYGCLGESVKVFEEMEVRDVVTWNALVSSFLRHGLAKGSAWKDEVLRNSLIAGCVKHGRYEEAFLVMSSMRPNAVALTTALAACSDNSDLWIGMQIHCVALRFGFIANTQLCNVLLDMYAKCGRILKSRSIFDGICHKTVVSWTSMIDAYGRHGHGEEALKLFKEMGQEGSRVLPNSVTLLAVLSACGHSGLVKEGRELFNSAREKYGLDPNQEHYSCLIDILGRAGLIRRCMVPFS